MTGQDPLAGGQEVKQAKFAFGKVGDWIKGTYCGAKQVKTANGDSTIYELKGIMGNYHPTEQDENGNNIAQAQAVEVEPGEFYAIWSDKGKQIDQGFKKAMIGQVVGIKFEELVKSATPGNKPWKKKKFLLFDMDPEYMGENSSMITTEQE